eukprot:748625-Pleurochrysis_carterae.AAC.1
MQTLRQVPASQMQIAGKGSHAQSQTCTHKFAPTRRERRLPSTSKPVLLMKDRDQLDFTVPRERRQAAHSIQAAVRKMENMAAVTSRPRESATAATFAKPSRRNPTFPPQPYFPATALLSRQSPTFPPKPSLPTKTQPSRQGSAFPQKSNSPANSVVRAQTHFHLTPPSTFIIPLSTPTQPFTCMH